jgi:hypothetical protein
LTKKKFFSRNVGEAFTPEGLPRQSVVVKKSDSLLGIADPLVSDYCVPRRHVKEAPQNNVNHTFTKLMIQEGPAGLSGSKAGKLTYWSRHHKCRSKPFGHDHRNARVVATICVVFN